MSEEKKTNKPRAKKAPKVVKTESVVLSESDLKYEGLTNLVEQLKRGARVVKEGREYLLEIRPIVGKRMKLHKYLYVRIGATVEEVAKVLVGKSDSPHADLTEDALPQLKKIEATLTALLSAKTRVRFDA